MYKISVIIPIHNGLEFTKTGLSSLKKSIGALKNIEIIVIDDGSTDGSAKWIAGNYPEVKILYGDGNLWWTKSINIGVKFAMEELKTDYILLWNNDIECREDYFINLNEILKRANPELIIGSLVVHKKREKYILSYGGYINLRSGRKKLNFSGESIEKVSLIEREADWLPGRGTVINKSIIHDVGYWDCINCPQVYGDIDFTIRAKKKGHKIIVFPELKIFNNSGQTSLIHRNSFRLLIKSLFYKNSNFNIYWDIQFHKKHFRAVFFIFTLLEKYFRYIGGFFKHKILNLLNLIFKNK